ALVDLDLVSERVRGLQWIGYVRCGNAYIDSRIFLASADRPFERQHEIAKLLLGVPVKTIPAGSFEYRAMVNHGGRTAALFQHLPIRGRQRERRKACGRGFDRCRDDCIGGAASERKRG